MTPEAEAKLRAVYERTKHLDVILGDPVWCAEGEGSLFESLAGDFYRAIRDALVESE